MDGRILELFMKENDAWDDMITRQSKEIPDLEKMLSTVVANKPFIAAEILSSLDVLKGEMHQQETIMAAIREELAIQQRILKHETKEHQDGFAVDTLLSQNVLREKIRGVEKKFLDLKCNFLNYLATSAL